jgi:hypothetical protein
MASAITAPLQVLNPIAAAIKGLYGIATDINAYMDEHIAGMKADPSRTISRTGHVLEAAKKGFGLGYVSSTAIIAAGQWMLGFKADTGFTIATAGTLTNPYVMTAAALGALLYGYQALNESERTALHENIGKGLETGVELIKSIIRFAIDTAKQLLSKENREEMKKYIREAAALFGRTLGDVTGKLADKLSDGMAALRGRTRNLFAQAARRGPKGSGSPGTT